MSDPRTFYESRLRELDAQQVALSQRGERIASFRIAVFLAFIAVAWASISRHWLSASWILVPIAAFALLVVLHERAKKALDRGAQIRDFYELGVARLDGTWVGRGDAGVEFIREHHPFANDLDVFGRGSLFEFLSVARTSIGRATLAHWLTSTPTMEEISSRGEAVAELRERIELRERLALVGRESSRALTSRELRSWATGERVEFTPLERFIAPLLALAGVATLVLLLARFEVTPFLVVVILQSLFGARLSGRIKALRDPIFHAAPELGRISEILDTVSAERFQSRRLSALFGSGDLSANFAVQRLVRLIDLYDAMRNQFFVAFGALLLWNAQISFRVAAWRDRWGRDLVQWMENIGELEALVSVATFAFDHPDYATPSVAHGSPHFSAENLAHPLLGKEAIGNDVLLDSNVALWIVSGSNMSGKSTLLRSIGTNLILAYCGAPVRAKRLNAALMNIGASIRINDSLQEGSSRFHAELMRIKQIVDLSGASLPLLFLLDEIFNGTNSHDRRIGAEAVLRRLLERPAIGLVTTHDLALAKLSESSNGRARNVHFEDQLENGTMRFDYRIKDGVVTHSNALELMRAVGLEV